MISSDAIKIAGDAAGVLSSGINTDPRGISVPIPFRNMSLAGMTAVKNTGTDFTTTISVADTYYQITGTSVTVGSITGGLTDNNDLTWTNNSGADKKIFGMIVLAGASATGTEDIHNIGVGTDNSGSLAVDIDNFGSYSGVVVTSNPVAFMYELTLNNGKFVAPIVQDYGGTVNLGWKQAKHYVWSYD